MSDLLTSSHGVYVPGLLIFHPDLSAAALLTWVRLRSLAWYGWETPPITLPELAAQLGLHPGRLARHLAQLNDIGALAMRDAGHKKVILSFPEEPILLPIPYQNADSYTSPTHPNLPRDNNVAPASYFPSRILGYLSYDDEQDPLYIEHDRGQLESIEAETAGKSSQLSLCAPAQPTFVGK